MKRSAEEDRRLRRDLSDVAWAFSSVQDDLAHDEEGGELSITNMRYCESGLRLFLQRQR